MRLCKPFLKVFLIFFRFFASAAHPALFAKNRTIISVFPRSMLSFHLRHYIHGSARIISLIHAHASLRVIALVPSVLQNFFASFVQNFVQSVCFHFPFAVRIRRKHVLLHHQFTRVKHFHQTSDEWVVFAHPRAHKTTITAQKSLPERETQPVKNLFDRFGGP